MKLLIDETYISDCILVVIVFLSIVSYFLGRDSKRRYTADGTNSCASLPISKGADQVVIVEIELLYVSLLRINYNTQQDISINRKLHISPIYEIIS